MKRRHVIERRLCRSDRRRDRFTGRFAKRRQPPAERTFGADIHMRRQFFHSIQQRLHLGNPLIQLPNQRRQFQLTPAAISSARGMILTADAGELINSDFTISRVPRGRLRSPWRHLNQDGGRVGLGRSGRAWLRRFPPMARKPEARGTDHPARSGLLPQFVRNIAFQKQTRRRPRLSGKVLNLLQCRRSHRDQSTPSAYRPAPGESDRAFPAQAAESVPAARLRHTPKNRHANPTATSRDFPPANPSPPHSPRFRDHSCDTQAARRSCDEIDKRIRRLPRLGEINAFPRDVRMKHRRHRPHHRRLIRKPRRKPHVHRHFIDVLQFPASFSISVRTRKSI